MSGKIRILGLDPSLVKCGWGVVEACGLKITHIAHGVIKPNPKQDLALRIKELYDNITLVIEAHTPDEAAVEDMFLKNNPNSAIKLGYARAMCLLAPTQAGTICGRIFSTQGQKVCGWHGRG